MWNAFFKTSFILGLICFTSSAFATDQQPNGFYVWASVIDVTPIVSTRHERIPTSQCRRVSEHRRRHHRDKASNADVLPVLFGGVLGGVIGNQFGRGNGKRAMTVIGALAGASIAGGRHQDINDKYPQKVCKTRYETHEVEAVEGYRVTYEYMGREFERVTEEHPGRKLKLYVTTEPVATNYI
ncbi:MAG: glycine zipper 2TM domain-containing protein [Gammaproteobacteria bacterium]|jgi:uncharacterized protein YcfJ|nr:glycine zipper 2TM domain-containing protein [Gammaproteobacteria bacterium]MBT4493402.1 glycine zipper 2TM domain-containing protein [Gammaproteobacteria bacterium]MBT7371844.1 glycine zipper 2TM domain-containing protein [Gammaproteobacteria bacterium]